MNPFGSTWQVGIAIGVIGLVASFSTYAGMRPVSSLTSDAGSDAAFLKAITICPSGNHPIEDGLRVLGGNLFGPVLGKSQAGNRSDRWVFEALAIYSPRALNLAIGAPDRIVGKIKLTTFYGSEPHDSRYQCVLEVVR